MRLGTWQRQKEGGRAHITVLDDVVLALLPVLASSLHSQRRLSSDAARASLLMRCIQTQLQHTINITHEIYIIQTKIRSWHKDPNKRNVRKHLS